MSAPLTVLVTGGGGGLGKAIATAFLAAGANVAICDVHQARLDATTQDWLAAGHNESRFLAAPADVTYPVSVQQLVGATVAKFGRLDVLVNNAGIMDDFSGVAECSPEMWNRVLDVNLHGPYNLTQAAIKQFETQQTRTTADVPGGGGDGGGGVIINICSSAAKCGHHAGAAYTASKHALLGLSRNTAFHYSDKGIYTIALVLGGMDTNVADGMKKGELDQAAFVRVQAAGAFDPARHLVAVENAARYVLFLSDREIARSANGSAVDFTNNRPEA